MDIGGRRQEPVQDRTDFGHAGNSGGFGIGSQSSILDESSRVIYAVESGVVLDQGWQNSENHNEGLGYRLRVLNANKSILWLYGHTDPFYMSFSSGDFVLVGQKIGRYASPTNGNSTGPHLHISGVNYQTGMFIKPENIYPLWGRGRVTSPYNILRRINNRISTHKGVDYVY